MSRGACNSEQAIRGVIRGSAQTRRGGRKVERTPRSEQECWSEQQWMGEWKQSDNLSGRRKWSGKRTGEQMYQMNVEGQEERLLDVEK